MNRVFSPAIALQILDESADGVVVTDHSLPDTPIIYMNAAFSNITGYSRAETMGRNCRFLQGSDREQPEIATMRDAGAAGRSVVVTLRNYRQDGSMFWNEVRIAPLFEAGDLEVSPRYHVGFLRDVTDRMTADMEQRQVQRAAEDANAAKEHFLKAVGHEFRTPIGIIIGFADLLIAAAERGHSEAQQLAYLGDIRGSAHHLLMMVEDARRYLWMRSPADLKRGHVLLSRAIEGAAQHAKPIMHDLGADLQIVMPAEVEIEADLPMIQQALANLITELARRATRGSNVAVELYAKEEQAVVEIKCSALVLPTIALSNLNLTLDHKKLLHRGLEGLGVSLIVAERIIRFHGGRLDVQSEHRIGTIAHVILPRAGSREILQ